ncbi:FHA domain-containing protein [Chloroflexia bacterium SDU3-3]|nr:FHA domain-containing protein [Chloroflexia bacterium SDU3-3]
MMEQSQNNPACLLALDPSVSPDEFMLVNESSSIGRSSLCDIVITARIASRIHARIERDGPRYLLVDAGSANGTFVNGARIAQPHVLQDSDAIGIGSALPSLRFLDPDPTYVPSPRLVFDERGMRFLLNQHPMDLPQSQLRLLVYLYRNAGALCTREACAQAIWGRDYDPGMDAGALDRVVANLRSTLREIDPETEFIQTRRGAGYMLEI